MEGMLRGVGRSEGGKKCKEEPKNFLKGGTEGQEKEREITERQDRGR